MGRSIDLEWKRCELDTMLAAEWASSWPTVHGNRSVSNLLAHEWVIHSLIQRLRVLSFIERLVYKTFSTSTSKCLFDTNHSKIQTGNIQQITLEKKNYQYILMTTKEQSVRRPLLRLSNRLRKGHLEGVSCHQNCQYSQSWIKESFSMWWLRA